MRTHRMLFADQKEIKVPIKVTKHEHNVEKQIENEIVKRHGYVIKNQAGSSTGRGKPDLSACLNGLYYGIEVKRFDASERIKTNLNQVTNLLAIAKAGGQAFYSKTAKMFDLQNGELVEMVKPYTVQIMNYLKEHDVLAIKINANKSMIVFRKKKNRC